MSKKILFVNNADWSFVSHRLPIALEALRQGYEVHLAASITDKREPLEKSGIIVHSLPLERGSTNPFTELKTFFAILCLFREIRPDLVHLITIKPVLYGGIAARLANIKAVVAAVPGLGFIFISRGFAASLRRIIVIIMYRLAFGAKNFTAIFQNPDDREMIMSITGLGADKTVMIRGSGVDLSQYNYVPVPHGTPIVALAARMLKDKGIQEFVEAATILKQNGINARFCLIGAPDPGNPSSISHEELKRWHEEGFVEVWGQRSDIADIFSKSSVVVLPSYREGLPKVLIEAAACGRAVVTTDVPGCRDAIEKNITGLLVPVKNPQALAEAMEKLLSDRKLSDEMGKAGRQLAEQEFNISGVISKHIQIYEKAIS